jgi:demethylmenaquinone methyltransferase / 2-methoxy-6-polyprenyl-1,4-benzoquinol methylase
MMPENIKLNTYPDPEKIRSMFSKVAANYDLGNSVLSLGIHHLWRKKVVQLAKVTEGMSVLEKYVGNTGLVVGTDFCAEMLQMAPEKSKKENLDIKFELADVTKLKYENNKFDRVSISFGIRNVSDPVLALKEMARVTKSGGLVLVLEFGQMTIPVISDLYNFYSLHILPKLGGLVTGQGAAYDYLQKSSATFPSRNKFLNLMHDAGSFSDVKFTSVSFGIAYIYVGVVK